MGLQGKANPFLSITGVQCFRWMHTLERELCIFVDRSDWYWVIQTSSKTAETSSQHYGKRCRRMFKKCAVYIGQDTRKIWGWLVRLHSRSQWDLCWISHMHQQWRAALSIINTEKLEMACFAGVTVHAVNAPEQHRHMEGEAVMIMGPMDHNVSICVFLNEIFID